MTILQYVSYSLGFEAFGVIVCSESLLNVELRGNGAGCVYKYMQ